MLYRLCALVWGLEVQSTKLLTLQMRERETGELNTQLYPGTVE